jgi:hypothetical protein
MKTSNFFDYKGENGVSIAGGAPDWFTGRQYKKLAPKYWFFKKYKDGEFNRADYTFHYIIEVLDKLDAKQVYEELGEDAVLLCWERSEPDFFCHRSLVAAWFKDRLGVDVDELETK